MRTPTAIVLGLALAAVLGAGTVAGLFGTLNGDSDGSLIDVAVAIDSDLVVSTVATTSTPGFLAEPQVEDDQLPLELVKTLLVDAESTRYQGEWDGQDVFLAVRGVNTVQVVTGERPRDLEAPFEGWGSGSTIGNAVIGFAGDGTEVTLQYVPQGTATVPDGWSALSHWMIVKDARQR